MEKYIAMASAHTGKTRARSALRLAGFAALCATLTPMAGCSRSAQREAKAPDEVVVYCSVDEVYARPLLQKFSEATGIAVRYVGDTEETKSTGLLLRLLAEKDRPQADVFWSGDAVRAAVLANQGLTVPLPGPAMDGASTTNSLGLFSARLRVIIYNRRLLPEGQEPPRSVFDLVNPKYKGKACIANPLFGTTAMHAAALLTRLGDAEARRFFGGMRTNEVRVLSSNGEVRRRVAAGDYLFGLTDSDDVNVALKDGQPVGYTLPDQDGMGTLLVPNAVVLIRNAPHPDNARRVAQYLLSVDVERALAESDAAQLPMNHDVPLPAMFTQPLRDTRLMPVDYAALAKAIQEMGRNFLEDWVMQSSR